MIRQDSDKKDAMFSRVAKQLIYAVCLMTIGAVYYGIQTETIDQCLALHGPIDNLAYLKN